MENELRRLKVEIKTGDEPFLILGTPAGFDVRSFWQWSASDLVNNSMRGVLAEYLVARSLGLDVTKPREPWANFDLETGDGSKIEVKSAALVQSWHQERLSKPTFNYRETLGWDADTNLQSDRPGRYADIYVFALLAHEDKPTINPLNLDQWKFYIAATRAIANRERSQHSISLNSLESLCKDEREPLWRGPLKYGKQLARAVADLSALTQ